MFQQLQADRLIFLRMKLRGTNVVARNGEGICFLAEDEHGPASRVARLTSWRKTTGRTVCILQAEKLGSISYHTLIQIVMIGDDLRNFVHWEPIP